MCLKGAEKKKLRNGWLITFRKYRSSHLSFSIKKLFYLIQNIMKIFKSTYFEENVRTTASENVFKKLRQIKNYS